MRASGVLLLACAVFFWGVAGLGFAQEPGDATDSANSDLDSLFDEADDFGEDDSSDAAGADEDGDGAADGSSDTQAVVESIDLDALTTRALRLSGGAEVEGGLLFGLEEWPGSGDAGDQSFTDLLTGIPLYDMSANIRLDARPKGNIRFFAKLTTELDTDDMQFPTLSFSELFVDYTLADNYFFRVGKQSMTWGQARLLGNPGNLVSDVSDGVALRSFVPLGTNGVTAVIHSTGDFGDSGAPRPDEFVYAGQYDMSLGDFTLGTAARYSYSEDLRLHTTGYVKTALAGADIAVEGGAHWDTARFYTRKEGFFRDGNPVADGVPRWWAIANVFREFGDPVWQVIAEYRFNSEIDDYRGHYAAAALRAPKIGRWTPALRWKHAFQDASGELVAGIDGSVAPNLRASFGIPVTYGAADSYYREASEVPGDSVIALITRISLKFSF